MVSLEALQAKRNEAAFAGMPFSPTWVEAELVARMGMGMEVPDEVAAAFDGISEADKAVAGLVDSYRSAISLLKLQGQKSEFGKLCIQVMVPYLGERHTANNDLLESELYAANLSLAMAQVGLLLIIHD